MSANTSGLRRQLVERAFAAPATRSGSVSERLFLTGPTYTGMIMKITLIVKATLNPFVVMIILYHDYDHAP